MNAACFKGSYADWKLVKTRGVVQIILEVPLHEADLAYQVVGGMPDAATERWFAVARLQEPNREPRKVTTFKSRSWHEMSPAQQAGVLCQDNVFAKFLAERDGNCGIYTADRCANLVRAICGGIASRKDIKPGTKAEQLWRALVSDYRAWVREPEVVG
jgi:hypothetical protein